MRDDIKLTGAVRWLGLGVAGLFGGVLLGGVVIGDSWRLTDDSHFSYAQYGGNPDALAVDSLAVEQCYGCADSYGAARRLNADRIQRMDGAFRQLGAVEVDQDPPDDGYRYGGNFDDARAAVAVDEHAPKLQSDAQDSNDAPSIVQATIAPKVDSDTAREVAAP